MEVVFFQSVSTTGGDAPGTSTTLALFKGYCGADVERTIDPSCSGPSGGGKMKSDVGQRKYVLVKDMASGLGFA